MPQLKCYAIASPMLMCVYFYVYLPFKLITYNFVIGVEMVEAEIFITLRLWDEEIMILVTFFTI